MRLTGERSTRRIHYVDWLRWAAVLAVVVYHALVPFGSLPWQVGNDERSDVIGFVTVLLPFAFPVFFLLAGASARFALESRPPRTFLAERTVRLLVPLVVGTLVLTPPTAYIIALHNGTWSGSLAGFLIAYPGIVLDYNIHNVGLRPLVFQIAMHLWFLGWLFIFSLLAPPIHAYLATRGGRSLTDLLARAARPRGGTLLFALPLTVIALPLFGLSSPAGWDWAAFGLWGGTFVGGYLMFSDERLVAAARRDLLPALAAAIIGVGGLAATGFTSSIFEGGEHTYDATYVLLVGIHGLAAWGVTLAALSAGMRLGFMQRPLGRRAREVAMPTYVLHFPLVVALSVLVVQLPIGLWAKVAINVGAGLAVTFLVATAATRIPLVRPLLGLRRRDAAIIPGRPAARTSVETGPGSRP